MRVTPNLDTTATMRTQLGVVLAVALGTGALAAPATWVTNAASVTDDGTNKSVTLPATNNSLFFRLKRN